MELGHVIRELTTDPRPFHVVPDLDPDISSAIEFIRIRTDDELVEDHISFSRLERVR